MLCINVCDPALREELLKALAYRAEVLSLVGRYLAPYTKAILGALDELRELGAGGGLSPQSRAPLAELAEALRRYEDWVRSAQEAAPWEKQGRGPVFTLQGPVAEEDLHTAWGGAGAFEVSEIFGLDRMTPEELTESEFSPRHTWAEDDTEDLDPPSEEDLIDSLAGAE